MNKKMMSLAVAAALVAPLTAQADVTAYAGFRMGVAVVNDGTNSFIGMATDASRLGLKGSSDLDNGMQAIFQLETEVLPDASGATTFGRNTFVGLKGGFGTVRFGKFDTAYKSITGKMDPFGDTYGDITGIGLSSTFDARVANTVSYDNKFGGMWVGVDLHLSEAVGGSMGNTIGVKVPMGDSQLVLGNTTLPDAGGSASKVGYSMKMGNSKMNFIYEMVSGGSNNMVVNGDFGGLALGYYSDGTNSQIAAGYFKKLGKAMKVGLVYTSVSGTGSRIGKNVTGFSATPTNPNAIEFTINANF